MHRTSQSCHTPRRHLDAMVSEGEEVPTRGTHKLFVNRDKIPEAKWAPPFTEEDWVLRQVLYQSIGEGETIVMKEVCTHIGVKIAGQKVAGLGRVVWRQPDPGF